MKILIAEDSFNYGVILKSYLESHGYDYIWVQDGLMAEEKLLEEDFDLLITDILMPGRDGFELLKLIKEKSINIKIIVLTGKKTEVDAVRALELGADEFVTKPFNLEEFGVRLRKLMGKVDD